ncbi:hypothetical protein CKO15_12220 [Halorhodospira abdelmalekii]|uniref:DUF2452 domain-containing protein n=1 Tax=Halorhodospira abdelmalekii TaxID=421629 RepID=UPI0019062080|nr:DUF2452 domain-containing protein [Halorhodospira abdelmalekii]MBK1736028.1 hypothetical protein [Halorhodospira abdelmalekii]
MAEYKRDDNPDRHEGPDHSSPYPVSRLAAPIDLVDTAREIQEADQAVGNRTSAKLSVIAEQIRALQEQAREVLAESQRDMDLHRARCNFKRRPGHIYHLYERPDGDLYFSMLAPEEWRDGPPHLYRGSYRLEVDFSWTPLEQLDQPDETRDLVQRLIADYRGG